MKEGSLKAPTRHPIDWKSKDFIDKKLLFNELDRVFDICHTCRRCISLCKAFPTLFDLIDESDSGELDSVKKSSYWDVIDKCYLCDMCYMSKCPYVPPHEWNVDFPHLMLRAKVYKFKNKKTNIRDKIVSSTDNLGKFATIPIVDKTVNYINSNALSRKIIDKTFGIHEKRVLPKYQSKTFRKNFRKNSELRTDDNISEDKVAIYSTCYVNYNEPNIGNDFLKILYHNGINPKLVTEEKCCGMPKFELGDLESVEKLKDFNTPILSDLALDGYKIIILVPSCTLMFKQELPLLFPDDKDLKNVKKATYDPFEFMYELYKSKKLNTNFKKSLGNISYHVPCHLRVQNIGFKTKEILQLIPGTNINVVERCSGHDGTWGIKKEYYDMSMKIGKPVFNRMSSNNPDYISSDCAIAGIHIKQGISDEKKINVKKLHPISLLRLSYQI